MAKLILTGSVGTGGAKKGLPHNSEEDIRKVTERLSELGYPVHAEKTLQKRERKNNPKLKGVARTTTASKKLDRTIRLFQAICKGQRRVKGNKKSKDADGRIDLHGNTHRWLAAENAPRWVNMKDKSGPGFKCVTCDYRNTYATSWMLEKLKSAGWSYMKRAFSSGLERSTWPRMWVRDFSRHTGGRTQGHGTHQTGLNVDMRLPVIEQSKYQPGMAFKSGEGSGSYDKFFDRDVAKLQLQAIKEKMTNNKKGNILFNDKKLRRAGLCNKYANHGGHYHITIFPPTRIDGIYK